MVKQLNINLTLARKAVHVNEKVPISVQTETTWEKLPFRQDTYHDPLTLTDLLGQQHVIVQNDEPDWPPGIMWLL